MGYEVNYFHHAALYILNHKLVLIFNSLCDWHQQTKQKKTQKKTVMFLFQ
jgi:hypothetical protein